MNLLCSNGRVRRVVSVALLLVMVATVFPAAAFAAVSTKDAYYMCQAASSAKIYKKSSTSSSVVTSVSAGTELAITGQSNNELYWIVKTSSGNKGYIPKSQVTNLAPAAMAGGSATWGYSGGGSGGGNTGNGGPGGGSAGGLQRSRNPYESYILMNGQVHDTFDYTINGEVAYCIQPDVSAPSNGSSMSQCSNPLTATQQNGVMCIISWGYNFGWNVFNPYGLDASAARCCTTWAIRKYLSMTGGAGSRYQNLSGPSSMINYIDFLVSRARSGDMFLPATNISPEVVELADRGSYYEGYATALIRAANYWEINLSPGVPASFRVTDMNGRTSGYLSANDYRNNATYQMTLRIQVSKEDARAYGWDTSGASVGYFYVSPVLNNYSMGRAFYACRSNGSGQVLLCTSGGNAGGRRSQGAWRVPRSVDATVQIIKADDSTGARLAGAVFGLYSDAACTNLLMTATTDSNGVATFSKLTNGGTYYVKEISAPPGYLLSTSIMTFATGSNTSTGVYQGTAVNTRQYGVVAVQKHDASGKTDVNFAGTTFNVLDSLNRVAGTIVIGSNNKGICNTRLPVGRYTIVEVSTVDGYQLNTEPIPFEIVADNTGKPIIVGLNVYNVEDGGYIRVTKVDKDLVEGTAAPGDIFVTEENPDVSQALGEGRLVNIQFGLYDENKKLIQEFTTGNSSIAKIQVNYGTYYIRELGAPKGYVLNDEFVPVTVSAETVDENRIVNIVYKNSAQKAQLQLQKGRDTQNGKDPMKNPMANVEFEVRHKATGTLVEVLVTGDNGIATSRPLPLGEYTVTERAESHPATLRTLDPFDVVLDTPEEIVSRKLVNVPYSSEVIVRTLDYAGNPIAAAGMRYKLVDVAGGPLAIQHNAPENEGYELEGVSDANGEVHFTGGIPKGTYTVHQITAADGYVVAKQPVEVVVDEKHENAEHKVIATFYNGETGNNISIEVTKRSVTSFDRFTSDGYGAVMRPMYGDVPAENVRVHLSLRTEDNEGYIASSNTRLYTDSNGIADFGDVEKSNDYTGNVIVPEGFVTDGPQKVGIDNSAGPAVARFKLIQQSVTLRLAVQGGKNGEYAAMKDFSFLVQSTAPIVSANGQVLPAGSAVDVITTGLTGVATSNPLPAESGYTLKLIDAPAGYRGKIGETYTVAKPEAFTEASKEIDVNALVNGGNPVRYDADLRPIRIEKKDNEGKPITGAQFSVTDAGGTVVENLTTGADGAATTAALPVGSYTVTETSVPAPYIPNTDPVSLDTTPKASETPVSGTTYAAAVVEHFTPSPGRVVISKQDPEQGNIGVPGGSIRMTSKTDDSVTFDAIADAEGKYRFSDIPAGSYSYAETAVSPGYLPDSTQRSISLDELGTVTGDIFYTGTRTSVTVTSVVGDENCTTCPAIGGVGVAIVSSNGGAVVADVQYTDENGYAVFRGLVPGDYSVTVKNAPFGYASIKPAYAFTLNANGDASGETTVKLQTNSVDVQLVDASGAPVRVAGGRFQLYKADDDSIVATAAADAGGKVAFLTVPGGTYYMKQLLATPGYLLNSEKLENIVVSADGSSEDMTFVQKQTSVTLTVVASDGAPVAGTFILRSGSGDEAQSIESGTSVSLPTGTYVAALSTVPDGYGLKKDNNYLSFKVMADGRIDGDTSMTVYPLQVKVRMLGVSGLEYNGGTTFRVRDDNSGAWANNGQVYTMPAGGDANTLAVRLAQGSYSILVDSVPNGYRAPAAVSFMVGAYDIDALPVEVSVQLVQDYVLNTTMPAEYAGSTVHITGRNTERSATVDSSGAASFSGLEPGSYTITVSNPPSGMIAPDSKTVNISAAVTNVTLPGQSTGMRIGAYAVDGGSLLKNSKFEVRNASNQLMTFTQSTGNAYDYAADGAVTQLIQGDTELLLIGLPFGTYTVKQVDTGDAAYRPDSSMTGLISARTTEGTPLSIQFINSRITKVTLSAEDSVAAKPIPQVTFSIYRNGMAYTTATTGTGGSVELELPFGGYSWVVASAPAGYPVGKIGAFTVENDGTVNGNTVARMAVVSVPLKAVDSDGRPVKGVTFGITSTEDSVDNVVTDETGVAAFVAKCETTYNVMVESVPAGCRKPSMRMSLTTGSGGELPNIEPFVITPTMVKLISTTIGGDTVIKGTSYTVSAGVDKVRFRMLSGGTYAYDASGSVTTLVSDDKGEVLIYGLPDGNYGSRLVGLPETYQPDKERMGWDMIQSSSMMNASSAQMVIHTVVPAAEIRLTLIDDYSGEHMGAGMKVAVYDTISGVSIGEFTTDANGAVDVGRLSPGGYSVKVSNIPNGYISVPVQQFGIDSTGRTSGTTEIRVAPRSVSATINNDVPDVTENEFQVRNSKDEILRFIRNEEGDYIYDWNNDPSASTVVKPKPSGHLDFYYMPTGSYTLDQTRFAAGIRVPSSESDIPKVNDSGDGDGGDGNITPSPTPGTPTPLPTPGQGGTPVIPTPVPTPTQGIIDSIGGGSVYATPTPDGYGVVVNPGYAAPAQDAYYNYYGGGPGSVVVVNPGSSGIVLNADENSSGRYQTRQPTYITNPQLNTATLKAIDAKTMQPLAGVTVVLKDSAGRQVLKGQTASNGTLVAERLAAGAYSYTVIGVPATYAVPSNTFSISVAENGQVTASTVMEIEPVTIAIRKVDSLSKAGLANAVFHLKNANGDKVAVATSGADGMIWFEYLPIGEYTINESKAPSGYALSNQVYKIVVTEVYSNKETVDIPNSKFVQTGAEDSSGAPGTALTVSVEQEDASHVRLYIIGGAIAVALLVVAAIYLAASGKRLLIRGRKKD